MAGRSVIPLALGVSEPVGWQLQWWAAAMSVAYVAYRYGPCSRPMVWKVSRDLTALMPYLRCHSLEVLWWGPSILHA